jgi:hypothetical protein
MRRGLTNKPDRLPAYSKAFNALNKASNLSKAIACLVASKNEMFLISHADGPKWSNS